MCLFAINAKAQETLKTNTFTVKGNCEDCRKVIENAADIKGVKKCAWDEKTKVATVLYDSTKTTLLTIQKAIAARGYEAGEVSANEKAYKKLPKCCKYRNVKCEEENK
jgi:copper chaperone CopZ